MSVISLVGNTFDKHYENTGEIHVQVLAFMLSLFIHVLVFIKKKYNN